MKKVILTTLLISTALSQGQSVFAENLGSCPKKIYSSVVKKEEGALTFYIPKNNFKKPREGNVREFKEAAIQAPSSRIIRCRYEGRKTDEVLVHVPEAYKFHTCTVGGRNKCKNSDPKKCIIACEKR